MIKSISYNQEDIIRDIITLYCPKGKIDADLTYGNGSFYKNIPKPDVCLDIQPLFEHVIRADSRNTGLPSNCFDSIMFDPPFLTYIKKGRNHKEGKMVMSSRFGGYYTYQELSDHYVGTLREASRILKKKGVLIFKCQDIIHNHKIHPTHINVVNWGSELGFRLKDLFILAAKNRMPGPQKGKQRHARIFHSYFLVLENNQ